MSSSALAKWHHIVLNKDVVALDLLLADEVVFHSPIIHTPQVGKAITQRYLTAACAVFFNETFRYVREVVNGHDAMLEFLVTVDDIIVNGVDMIKSNDDGQIVEFKVMLRPLKGINVIHEKMAAMLQQDRNI